MDRHAAAVAAQEDGRGGPGAAGRGAELIAIQPVLLLADSQPLFWRDEAGRPWLDPLLDDLRAERPGGLLAAAYVGAANGDDPAYYSIFQGAMEALGIVDRRMILARFPADDRAFVARADLILLAGGDPLRGWRAMAASGLAEAVAARFYDGALLAGVSAGAVQLGWGTAEAPEGGLRTLVSTFQRVPFYVGVHEEADDWRELAATVAASGTHVPGLGIPFGGAAVLHADGTLQPAGRPAVEVTAAEGGTIHTHLLLPPAAEAARAVAAQA